MQSLIAPAPHLTCPWHNATLRREKSAESKDGITKIKILFNSLSEGITVFQPSERQNFLFTVLSWFEVFFFVFFYFVFCLGKIN